MLELTLLSRSLLVLSSKHRWSCSARPCRIGFLVVVAASCGERVTIAHLTRALDFLDRLAILNLGAFKLGGRLRILVRPSLLILLVRRGIATQVPRIVHHQSEVVIVVDTNRDVFVVLSELFEVYPAVILCPLSQVVMRFKRFQELNENLFFAALPLNHIWVLARIVGISDVIDI